MKKINQVKMRMEGVTRTRAVMWIRGLVARTSAAMDLGVTAAEMTISRTTRAVTMTVLVAEITISRTSRAVAEAALRVTYMISQMGLGVSLGE
jgi:hypothetical protein